MSEGNLWRYSALSPRFLMVDASAAYPLIIFLAHMRPWTLYLSLAFIAALWLVESQGMSPKAVFHFLRARVGQWLGGGVRAEPMWFHLQRRNLR